MFLPYLILLTGFFLLVKGADFFVSGASTIAQALRVPSLIIGLTIVAFGTSAPEAAVSITAALSGSNDIALGNVIGSNIFNLLMVVGLCAILRPVGVEKVVLRRDFPFALLACVMLLFLCWGGSMQTDGVLTRLDGLALLVVFSFFLGGMLKAALKARAEDPPMEARPVPMSLKGAVWVAVGGAVAIVIGGQLTVNAASTIALSWGISEALVGLTIVAVGTSLPELVTSVVAARKGESDIAIGNAIGSNIFNVFFVLGSSVAVHPLHVPAQTLLDLLFLTGVSVLAYLFACTKHKVERWEGGIMALCYVAYTVYICLR